MRRVLVCMALVGAWAQQPPSPVYPPEALASELRRLRTELTEGRTIAGLPSAWEVQTPERHYSIPTEPLRALLPSGEQHQQKVNGQAAEDWLEQLALELDGAAAGPSYSPAAARKKLDAILTRPEFAGLREPSAWDLWRQRAAAWMERFLTWLFRPLARHPMGGVVLFWFFILAVTGTLAVWLIRRWTDRGWIRVAPAGGPMPLQGWEQWVRMARQAAEKGDFRGAIHGVYWAGVVYLQSAGVLPVDPARTPREYLRALATARDGTGAHSRVAQPLGALTAGLERYWYARQTPRAEDFQASLTDLEALGCKLD